MRVDHEPVSMAKWTEIVGKLDNASFTHTPAWARIIEDTYGFTNASRIYRLGDDDVFFPLMKKNTLGHTFYSSMPYGDGNVFMGKASPERVNDVMGDLFSSRAIFLDLFLPPFTGLELRKDLVVRKEIKYTHVLPLEDGFERTFAKFNKAGRKLIRKAERSGVEVVEGTSLDDFRTFYRLYEKESIERWGYARSHLPLALFENLHEYGNGGVRLSLAKMDGKVIAGAISLLYGKMALGFVNSFLEEYGSYSPSRLLLKESIEHACREGYRYYDLGSSEGQKSLHAFKEGLGAFETSIVHYRIGSYLGRVVDRAIAIARSTRMPAWPRGRSKEYAAGTVPMPAKT